VEPNQLDDLRIQQTRFQLNSRNSDTDLVVPIYSTTSNNKRVIIGAIEIPGGTFSADCTLSVESGSTDPNTEIEKQSQCIGESSSTLSDFLSPRISITISGKGCGNPASLSNLLTIDLIGKDASSEDSCVAFVEKEEDPWRCLSNTEKLFKANSLAIYRSKTGHLT